ncbi:MAG: GNAT family N-acetyltransferase [Pseudomonadota bacterium]
MTIELSLVPFNQRLRLKQYLDHYLMEHAQFKEHKKGPLTSSQYIYFSDYWRGKGRYPYFIVQDGAELGFALVRAVFDEEELCHRVSEFYIAPEFRRAGAGKKAVELLWQMHPGRWKLQVLANNITARVFWESCCDAFAKEAFSVEEIHSEDGKRHRFNLEV